MKLKHIFLISCLLGAVTILNAQGDTKSISYWSGPQMFWTPIDCDKDGNPEDIIVAEVEIYHQIMHIKDGVPVWSRNNIRGEGYSIFSGEKFDYHTINVRSGENGELVTWQFILRSPNAKYTGKVSVNFSTGELIFKNIVCK